MCGEAWLGTTSDMVGYVGAGVLVLTYWVNQAGRLRSEDWRFPALNLLGSGLVMISLIYRLNPPSLAIEIFWSSISVYGIQRNVRAARARLRRAGSDSANS